MNAPAIPPAPAPMRARSKTERVLKREIGLCEARAVQFRELGFDGVLSN